MTDTRHSPTTRSRRRPRQLLPGPAHGAHPGDPRERPGHVIAVYSSDSGSKIDIPKWVEKAGHRLVGVERRDGYDEIVVEKTH